MGAMDFPTLFAHLHPVLVHFPIAALLFVPVFEWVALVRRAPPFGPAPRGLLWLGLLVGGLAVLSGLRLEGELISDPDPERRRVFERHEVSAFCAAGAAALSVVFGETLRRKPSRGVRAAYLVLAHAAAAAVAIAGAAGGLLLWGPEWLPW
jgi:uncharacterized membrane protein